jgi:L,D-transpeptidase ErfK/SrfK
MLNLMRKTNQVNIFFFLLAFLLAMPALALPSTELRINVPSRTLQLIRAGKLIKEYSVGVGSSKANMTPPGIYTVDKKVINPIWEHPYKAPGESQVNSGENNPLGTRWIGFHAKGSGVYGIHGTNQPSSIGHFVSHGCVRMHNSEVEELFDLVDYNTPVIVTYNRYKLHQVGNSISLEVFPDPYGYKSIQANEIIENIRQIDFQAQIDYTLLEKAVKDISEKSIYEIAVKRAPQMHNVPAFSDPYAGAYMRPMEIFYQYPPLPIYSPYPSYNYYQ